jgi:hypothetical protein
LALFSHKVCLVCRKQKEACNAGRPLLMTVAAFCRCPEPEVRTGIMCPHFSWGPLHRNAATVTSCKYPALPAFFCYRKTWQNVWRNHWQRQAYAAQNGGHGGAARPRNRGGYGSLSESAVEPEPASESVDDKNEVVSRSSASPYSSAAAAPSLAAARAVLALAASCNGRTTWPARCSPSSACRHHVPPFLLP